MAKIEKTLNKNLAKKGVFLYYPYFNQSPTKKGVFLYFCPNPNQSPTKKGSYSILLPLS